MPRDLRVLVVADTHSGSLAAPIPPDCTTIDPMTKDEMDFTPTKYQEALNECWMTMVDSVGRVDLVIANGDLADGVQPKSDGLSCWTTDKVCQAKNAAKLLKTIRCEKFRISQGSPYHVAENMCIDEMVADYLSKFKSDVGYKPSFIERIKDRDVRMHVLHKVGTSQSTWQYLTTPLARDLVLLKLNDSVRKYGKVQLCIRSHAHIYVEAGYSSTRGFVSPAWQGPTPFMISHGIITPPEIGYVLVTIQTDGYLHVRPTVFPMQMPLGVFDD